MEHSLRVLHIGDEMNWRGGENQIRLLISHSQSESVCHYVAYPKGSRGLNQFSEICPVIGFATSKINPSRVSMLVRFCRERQIQILHAQSSGGHSLALQIKKRLPHLKLVVHRRVDNPIKKSPFTKKKYLNEKVDRYIVISECIQNMLTEYGVPADKITLVRSAIDISAYDEQNPEKERLNLLKKLNLSQETVLVGNASAFTHQKAYEVLIKAVAQLHTDKPFHVVLSGDGPLLSGMKKLSEKEGVDHKITFLGFQRNVPSLLSALDILTVPSHNEGLGSLLLDGAAAGCALIATQVGGIPEIVKHEETGLLCSPNDPQELAFHMNRLIDNPEQRARLVQTARLFVNDKFSLEKMVNGNLQVYKSIL